MRLLLIGAPHKLLRDPFGLYLSICVFLRADPIRRHICFAFSMIVKIIEAFGLYNVPLFIVTTAATFLIFALVYMLVYILTARVYYKIVR